MFGDSSHHTAVVVHIFKRENLVLATLEDSGSRGVQLDVACKSPPDDEKPPSHRGDATLSGISNSNEARPSSNAQTSIQTCNHSNLDLKTKTLIDDDEAQYHLLSATEAERLASIPSAEEATQFQPEGDDVLLLTLLDGHNQCFVCLKRESDHIVLPDRYNQNLRLTFTEPIASAVADLEPVFLYNDEVGSGKPEANTPAEEQWPEMQPTAIPPTSLFVARRSHRINSFRTELLLELESGQGVTLMTQLVRSVLGHDSNSNALTLSSVVDIVAFFGEIAPHLRGQRMESVRREQSVCLLLPTSNVSV